MAQQLINWKQESLTIQSNKVKAHYHASDAQTMKDVARMESAKDMFVAEHLRYLGKVMLLLHMWLKADARLALVTKFQTLLRPDAFHALQENLLYNQVELLHAKKHNVMQDPLINLELDNAQDAQTTYALSKVVEHKDVLLQFVIHKHQLLTETAVANSAQLVESQIHPREIAFPKLAQNGPVVSP